MSFTRVTAQLASAIAHLNQYADHLEGVSGNTLAWLLRVATSENFVVILADNAGVSKFLIKDLAGNTVATIDSDGNLTIAGSLTNSGALVLPTSAAPAQTAEGSIAWDSDDNRIVVGDGATAQAFYPGPSAVVLVGSNSTEQTTTSTSAVDLVTISGLSITVDQPIRIIGVFRKDASSANAVGLGLKLNSTTVLEASTGASGIAASSGSQQAENGMFEVLIGPRSANYRGGMTSSYNSRISANGNGAVPPTWSSTGNFTALIPNETITSIVIRGINGTANNNLAVKDVRVYTMSSS